MTGFTRLTGLLILRIALADIVVSKVCRGIPIRSEAELTSFRPLRQGRTPTGIQEQSFRSRG